MNKLKFFTTFSCVAIIACAVQFNLGAEPLPAQAEAGAKSAASAVSSTAAAASTKGQSAEIKNGTKISADLMSNIDARKAKEGDKVVARVTKNVKQHGKVVVHKGDRLVGHVTSVQNGLKGKGGSSLGVRFDQLVQGNSTTQLNAVLTSVLAARGQEQGSGSMEMPSMPAPVAPPVAAEAGRRWIAGRCRWCRGFSWWRRGIHSGTGRRRSGRHHAEYAGSQFESRVVNPRAPDPHWIICFSLIFGRDKLNAEHAERQSAACIRDPHGLPGGRRQQLTSLAVEDEPLMNLKKAGAIRGRPFHLLQR